MNRVSVWCSFISLVAFGANFAAKYVIEPKLCTIVLSNKKRCHMPLGQGHSKCIFQNCFSSSTLQQMIWIIWLIRNFVELPHSRIVTLGQRSRSQQIFLCRRLPFLLSVLHVLMGHVAYKEKSPHSVVQACGFRPFSILSFSRSPSLSYH